MLLNLLQVDRSYFYFH